ncbi:MAG: ABC transporter ATP-binding protein [Desulfobacterota bacterium]|nr:ABC transporter ATP-binding protein [Thermodesulfobacteriota bacterium]
MDRKPVIEIQRLSFAYNGFTVLEDVNLTIVDREFICVVGPNGGGKTTLLKLVLGLLRPLRGSVRVFQEPPDNVRHRIGYVPQHAYIDPLFPVTALDVARMGRIRKGRRLGPFNKKDTNAAMNALHTMGLDAFARVPFAALSGGQRQRVLIARALAGDPELLLLDEPTTSLDLHVENQFYETLREINRRLTVVVVSHDVGLVTPFATSVVCVKRHVVIHPTSELSGDKIAELYGTDMLLVRHDHRCSAGGHECRNL